VVLLRLLEEKEEKEVEVVIERYGQSFLQKIEAV
jgi:hypothetical protein